MDLGKMLRDRMSSFRTYKNFPRSPPKNWGMYPKMIIDQLVFHEKDSFHCPIYLVSSDPIEIVKMRDAAIASANEGFKIGGWEFFLHAANNKILQDLKIYNVKINLVFKVRFPNIADEEVNNGKN